MTPQDPDPPASAKTWGDVPAPSLWQSRLVRWRDRAQSVYHYRATPYLAARTRGAGDLPARLRRRLDLRPGDAHALWLTADLLARNSEWEAFADFLDANEQVLRGRLSNAALALLSAHMRHHGWLEKAEFWLSPRLRRFPHSPVLVQAYALLGREARRRESVGVWSWVRRWHLARARDRASIGKALRAAGARDPDAPIETTIIDSGQGHLCAFLHRQGDVAVVEKLVEKWSPERQVLEGFARGRFRPPPAGLQVARLVHRAVEPAGVSLFLAERTAPPLEAGEVAARLDPLVGALAGFNAANVTAARGIPRLEERLSLAHHPEAMAPTLAMFPADEAEELRPAWQAVLDRREELAAAWRRLPSVLQHEDVHAENLLSTEPPTLIDWEHAVVGPAGAELRVLLMMSGEVQFDDAACARLVALYAESFRAAGVPLTEAQAALGLWWPYFARHAVAPSAHPHDLRLARRAILRGRALLDAPR